MWSRSKPWKLCIRTPARYHIVKKRMSCWFGAWWIPKLYLFKHSSPRPFSSRQLPSQLPFPQNPERNNKTKTIKGWELPVTYIFNGSLIVWLIWRIKAHQKLSTPDWSHFTPFVRRSFQLSPFIGLLLSLIDGRWIIQGDKREVRSKSSNKT